MQGSAGNASGRRSGSQQVGEGARRSWSPVVVLLIVLGATLIAQFAVEGILGQQAAANGNSQGQSCAFSFWVIKVGCSATFASNPEAQAAANLGSSLIPWFVLIDAVFIIAVAYVMVASRRDSSSRRRGELGAGRARRAMRR